MSRFSVQFFASHAIFLLGTIGAHTQAQERTSSGKDTSMIGGISVTQVPSILGAKMEAGLTAEQWQNYHRHFDFSDTNKDGILTKEEFIDNGKYMTPQARRGIFNASDSNENGSVSKAEYTLNRVITDEAKEIFRAMDNNQNRIVEKPEFIKYVGKKLKSEESAAEIFEAIDLNKDDQIVTPEYLRIWGQWARAGRQSPEKRLAKRREGLEKSGQASALPEQ